MKRCDWWMMMMMIMMMTMSRIVALVGTLAGHYLQKYRSFVNRHTAPHEHTIRHSVSCAIEFPII